MIDSIQKVSLYKNEKFFFWLCCLLAQFSFLTNVGLPYVAEEPVYTLGALEMVQNSDWISPTVFGANYARPPLMNWLIIPFANLFGWDHSLVVTRLIAGLSTLVLSFVLMGFVQRVFKNKNLALFSAIVFFSWDVLFRRGWLAYADPLFSLFVFGAIASVWIAVEEERLDFLALALTCVIASFLTKALTGYVFYGITVCVLFYRSANRRFLLRPSSIILHLGSLVFLLVWTQWISRGNHGPGMIVDIVTKLNMASLWQYIKKISFFPIDTFLRWLPASGLLVLFFWQNMRQKQTLPSLKDQALVTLLWIFGLNYLVYWVAPQSHFRYLMPLFPLIAIILAHFIWQLGHAKVKLTVIAVFVVVVARYIAGFWTFPFYDEKHQGNYENIAKEILEITRDKPLYTEDTTAKGLIIGAYICMQKLPEPTIKRVPNQDVDAFILSDNPGNLPNAKVKKVYQIGKSRLYVMCNRGACN